MRLDPNPLFRRIIMPWYDSPPMCWALLLAMIALMLFSMAGIAVARENHGFGRYIWVPWVLFYLCFFVGCSLVVRMLRRHFQQKEPEN